MRKERLNEYVVMLDKIMVLRRDIEKMREELGNELIKNTNNRVNDAKLIELSIKLDEILVKYMKAEKEIKVKK